MKFRCQQNKKSNLHPWIKHRTPNALLKFLINTYYCGGAREFVLFEKNGGEGKKFYLQILSPFPAKDNPSFVRDVIYAIHVISLVFEGDTVSSAFHLNAPRLT